MNCPHPRKTCYSRRFGYPKKKIWYRTREDADSAALEILHKHGRVLQPYACTGGEGFHLGTPRWKEALEKWGEELGARAAWCLYTENTGTERSRLLHIRRICRPATGHELPLR